MSASPDTLQQQAEPIPAPITVSKPRKCRTAPGIKTAVIQRRVNNQSKRRIASELGIGRNTVTRILEDSHVEQALECGIQSSVGLIPEAIKVAHDRLAKGSENMAIKVLENTIWPLQSKTSKPPDIGLTVAIQNLMQVNDAGTLHNNAAEPSTSQPAENTQVIEAEQVKS